MRDGWLLGARAASFALGIRFADGVWRIIEAAALDAKPRDRIATTAYLYHAPESGRSAADPI